METPMTFRWGVAVLSTIILVAVWGGYAQLSQTALEDQTKASVAQAETMVHAYEKNTHRALHEVDFTLATLAHEFREGGLPHLREAVDHGLFDASLIHHFTALDENGRALFRSEGRETALPPDSDDAIAFHRGTGSDLLFIGRPFAGSATGRPLLPLSRRMNRPDGSFGGIVVANLDPDDLSQMFVQSSLGPNGSVTLVGFDKVIRARVSQMPSVGIGQAVPGSLLWDELKRSLRGVYWQDSRTDGIRRAYAYQVVEGYPLIVVVGAAQRDIEAAVAGVRSTLLVIAVLLTISVVLVAVIVLVQHRATERLRFALSVNRDFLARTSHELRTPLNAILGFSEVIKDRMFGTDAMDRYAAYAAHIHESGGHLLMLIDDMLDLARLQAGRMPLTLEALPLEPAVEWAVRMIASQAAAKRIEVETRIDPTLSQVMADERALKQILLNLLSNAVKFTPEGGRIQVAAARGGNGRLRIRVSDTGVGMNADQLRRATVPFGQASSMVIQPGQGSGLGLSIVKSLMEAHGGTLRIESRPGEGSVMTLEFAA